MKLLLFFTFASVALGCDLVIRNGDGLEMLSETILQNEGTTRKICFDGINVVENVEIPVSRNVAYTSLNHENPAVIQASTPLNKWYRCNDGVRCPTNEWNEVFVHYVSDIVNLTRDFIPPRQLFVNGTRVSRVTRTGDEMGWISTPTGYATISGSNASSSLVENQVELRWPRSIQNWIEPRCIVTAVNQQNITVDPDCWKDLIARHGGQHPGLPTFVENIAEPPGPNEFMATSEYIFYRPSSSNPYEFPVNAFVPSSAKIFYASNLTNQTFSNLIFRHASWRVPSMKGGYVPTQTLVTDRFGEPEGAIEIHNSSQVTFQDCVFQNMGSAYVLSIGMASQDITIRDNVFQDLSGGAIKIGNVLGTRALSNLTSDWDTRYVVENNKIKSSSVEFRGGAALFAGYVADTNISHNTIENTGYTGISLGWGWGTHVFGPQTFARNNRIVGNRLLGVMSSLNDGGCTYTLGPQPNSFVTNNYCRSDNAPVVGCFYHDNGSRYFTTSGNVCENSPAPCVYLQGCCNSPAYDIAVSNLYCKSTAPVQNGCAAENCTIDSSTLYVLDSTQEWPPEAQSIIDSSGATIKF